MRQGFVKIVFFASVFLLVTTLTSCTPRPPRYPTAGDEIANTLKSSIKSNEQIEANAALQQKRAQNVNNDLLPPLKIQAPADDKSNPEHRFNVSAKDVPAKSFFMSLVSDTKYNMLVDPKTTGTITLELKDVTLDQTLDAVRKLYGYQFEKTPYGYQILPQAMKTQIFSVNYLDVKRTGKSQTQLVSTDITGTSSSSGAAGIPAANQMTGSGSTIETKSEDDFWEGLDKNLKTLIGDKDGRWVIVNPQASVVMIHAYPNEIYEASQYLDRIQSNLGREVIIEAKILEVRLSQGYQAGINWKALTLQQSGAILSDASSGDSNGAPGLEPDFNGGIFSMALSGHNGDFTSIIQLLETQGNVQVLSSPHISTINNQEAVIKVGQDEYFVTGYTSNVTPSGGSNTTSQSVALTPFFSGITLDVTPQISSEGEIVLYIHPSISTVEDQNKTINLGSGSSGSNTNSELTLPLAHSTIRESDSIVHARNGQIVVLGGLMQNTTSEKIAGTPGLSKIPVVGALARNTNQQSGKTELVILLRPMVVDKNTWTNQLNNSAQAFQKVQRGFHAGGLPDVFGTQAEAAP